MKMFWHNFYYGHKALLVDWVLKSHPFLFIIKEKIMSNYTSLLCRPQRLFPISSSLFVYSKEHNIILSLSNIFLKLSGIQRYRGHELLKKAFIILNVLKILRSSRLISKKIIDSLNEFWCFAPIPFVPESEEVFKGESS